MQVNNAMIRPANNIPPGANVQNKMDRPGHGKPVQEQAPTPATVRINDVPSVSEITVSDSPPVLRGGGPTEKEPTLRGLHQAWGTDDPQYDLNNDGTVDVLDLLEFITSMTPDKPPLTESAPNSELTVESGPNKTNNENGTEPTSGPPSPIGHPTSEPPTLEGLREAWGTDNPTYDLYADGTVDVLDLLELLSSMKGKPTEQEPRTGMNLSPTATDHLAKLTPEAYGQVRAISTSMLSQLKEAGFEKQPPVNLHQFVASMKLAPTQQDALLEELATHYPGGLGVDITG